MDFSVRIALVVSRGDLGTADFVLGWDIYNDMGVIRETAETYQLDWGKKAEKALELRLKFQLVLGAKSPPVASVPLAGSFDDNVHQLEAVGSWQYSFSHDRSSIYAFALKQNKRILMTGQV